jgi:hypothetical protein
MGGYGVPIVFGGVWAISTAVVGGIAAWKRWRAGGRGGGGSGRGHLLERPNGDGGDGGGSDDGEYTVAVQNGKRGGGSGNSGRAVAVHELTAANEVLLK